AWPLTPTLSQREREQKKPSPSGRGLGEGLTDEPIDDTLPLKRGPARAALNKIGEDSHHAASKDRAGRLARRLCPRPPGARRAEPRRHRHRDQDRQHHAL